MFFGLDPATWGVVGGFAAVVALIGIPLTVWAQFRSAAPKRPRLEWSCEWTPILMSGELHESTQVRVVRDDRELKAPYLLTLRLRVRGRTDITTEMFDRARPAVFHCGATVVDVVEAAVTASNAIPQYGYEAANLKLGPDHLVVGSLYTFTLLVDVGEGEVPTANVVRLVENHMINVDSAKTEMSQVSLREQESSPARDVLKSPRVWFTLLILFTISNLLSAAFVYLVGFLAGYLAGL